MAFSVGGQNRLAKGAPPPGLLERHGGGRALAMKERVAFIHIAVSDGAAAAVPSPGPGWERGPRVVAA
ncbi:hypothetical protein [Duganella radicis]|uniref:Uncharacterized protein n=1 Tax=Duganella radicis TaxID=551988 RepID=A0A6L6PPZ9_9BURK|nr:hypothetical protein [Duganella radicis]MTV41073.1 hypothetical protein [Duganella radicis]